MIWYGWLALAVGGLGYVVAWRRLVYVIAHDLRPQPDTPRLDDWYTAAFFSSIVAFAWPLIVAALVLRAYPNVRRVLIASARRTLIAEPKSARTKRLEDERRGRERYIERLERDLGIGR